MQRFTRVISTSNINLLKRSLSFTIKSVPFNEWADGVAKTLAPTTEQAIKQATDQAIKQGVLTIKKISNELVNEEMDPNSYDIKVSFNIGLASIEITRPKK